MEFDPVSYLMGAKAGGGGSAGYSLSGIAAVDGTREGASPTALSFNVKNRKGLFAAIICWSRGAMSPPTGSTVLYQTSREITGYTNYVTVIKCPIVTDDDTIIISNPTAGRCAGFCVVVDYDFTAEQVAIANNTQTTVTWPEGISLFMAVTGTSNSGSFAMLSGDTYPVAYVYPSDTPAGASTMTTRWLGGIINATTQGTALLGNYKADTSTGLFVCAHLPRED